MKKIYKYTFLLLALFMAAPAVAQSGDTDPDAEWITETENLWMKKTVKDKGDGTYTLTLQTYAKGSGNITYGVAPSDIVLAMDLSSSMNSNNVTITNEEKKERLSNGTSLTTGNIYKVVINGKEYYLKCIKRSDRNRWYYRYDSTEPTAYTSGEQFSDNAYYTSDGAYTVKEGDEIYLYTPGGEKQVTRLEALKIAAKDFVETVYANNPSTGFHNIAMVGFSSTTGTVKYNDGSMQAVNSTNKETMKSWIDDLKYTQGTRTDLGMQTAYDMLASLKDDGLAKTVVLFSDGCPSTTGGTNFNSSYARAAVNIAWAMKQELNKEINYKVTIPNQNSDNSFDGTETTFRYGLGATIYSVAVLSSETSGDNIHDSKITYDIRRMLHYISSNYNFAIEGTNYFFGADYADAACQIEGYSSSKGSEASHDYYQLSSGSDLSSIFKEIAGEASGGAKIKLDGESTVVLDVITNKFKIKTPDDPSSIKLYTCDVDKTKSLAAKKVVFETNTDGAEKWNDFVLATGKTIGDYIKINDDFIGYEPAEGKAPTDFIEVTGYDYASHWVGPIYDEGSTTDIIAYSDNGQKLIIQFDIKTDPANSGGLELKTNESTSGVYAKPEGKDTYEEVPDAKYVQPVVYLPYLRIHKTGLEVGESATFNVYKWDESHTNKTLVTTVILSKTEAGEDPVSTIKLQYTGDYEVEESDWAWSHTTTVKENGQGDYKEGNTDEQTLKTTESPESGYLDYYFGVNDPTTDTNPEHAEAVKVNYLGTPDGRTDDPAKATSK